MSVIIYQDHIEILEEENLLLKKEVRFLRRQLALVTDGTERRERNRSIN